MCEILFRGKRTDNGAWVQGSLVHRTLFYGYPCDDYLILSDGEFHCDYYEAEEVVSETVVQFTGLTDKNGKKIFEGDIIKAKNKLPDGKKHEAKVVADMDDFYLMWCIKHSIETEVIGNIYDNPELLEVTNEN